MMDGFINEVCEDYYSVNEDEYIDEYIENSRIEFYADWNEYIEDRGE